MALPRVCPNFYETNLQNRTVRKLLTSQPAPSACNFHRSCGGQIHIVACSQNYRKRLFYPPYAPYTCPKAPKAPASLQKQKCHALEKSCPSTSTVSICIVACSQNFGLGFLVNVVVVSVCSIQHSAPLQVLRANLQSSAGKCLREPRPRTTTGREAVPFEQIPCRASKKY
jgi:hypothetical protein